MIANNTMTFYGQEKVEYNAKLCLMKYGRAWSEPA